MSRKKTEGEKFARRRVIQTTTLGDRLAAFARRSRGEAEALPTGEAREILLRKAQAAEIALAPGGLVSSFALGQE